MKTVSDLIYVIAIVIQVIGEAYRSARTVDRICGAVGIPQRTVFDGPASWRVDKRLGVAVPRFDFVARDLARVVNSVSVAAPDREVLQVFSKT